MTVPVNETEIVILRALADDGKGVWTPDSLARALGWSRQKVTPVVNRIEKAGLVSARRLHKQTSYDITGLGQDSLRVYGGTP